MKWNKSLEECMQETLERMPSHWKLDAESNNYKLLSIICERFGNVYDSLAYMQKMWYIDTAEGVHLDNIGRDVGLNRNGMSDERYRRLLRIKEYLDLSNGTIPEIDTILGAFLEGNYYGVEDAWQTPTEEPAAMVVHVTKNADSLPFEVARLAKSGGVRIYYEAVFDELRVILYVREYEHKVFYPHVNINHAGYQVGLGMRDRLTVVSRPYEHKVFYDMTGINVTGTQYGTGARDSVELNIVNYGSLRYRSVVGIDVCGGYQSGFLNH